MENKIEIIDPAVRRELFRAEAGLIVGEPLVIGTSHADMQAELDFDLLRYVMEGASGE